MKGQLTRLVMALVMMTSFSSCSEYFYKHKHHEHSPGYNERHHRDNSQDHRKDRDDRRKD